MAKLGNTPLTEVINAYTTLSTTEDQVNTTKTKKTTKLVPACLLPSEFIVTTHYCSSGNGNRSSNVSGQSQPSISTDRVASTTTSTSETVSHRVPAAAAPGESSMTTSTPASSVKGNPQGKRPFTYAYTSELQDLTPRRIQTRSYRCHLPTRRLSKWLVEEARKYEDLRGRYRLVLVEDEDAPNGVDWRYKIEPVCGFVYMARVICDNRVPITKEFLDEMELMLSDRLEVTAWYLQQPCKKGSAFDKDNRRHQHFNDKITKVLQMLKRLPVIEG